MNNSEANNTNDEINRKIIAILMNEIDALRMQVSIIPTLNMQVEDLEDDVSALRRELIEATDDTPTDIEEPAPIAEVPEPAAPVTATPTTVSLAEAESVMKDALDKKGNPIADSTKKQVISMWKRATKNLADHSELDVFWAHVLAFVEATGTLSTRVKQFGQIKSVTGRLNLPQNGAFETRYIIDRAALSGSTKCKQISLPEIVSDFGCTDGTLLTTQKLQDTVESELCSPPASGKELTALLCLSFTSFHGNRGQDWIGMKYGKSHMQPGDIGYYDPETEMAHLYEGKTRSKQNQEESRGYVNFKVHPAVAKAIELHHKTMPECPYLVPLQNGMQATTDFFRTVLHETYFFEGNLHGFPVKVNPTDLRHLYETHIRYVTKLPDNEIDAIMKIIGHSQKTSVEMYSQMYIKMLDFNQIV